MRSLSDTINRLTAMRGHSAEALNADAAGRLSDFTPFGTNPGALKAKSYRPESLSNGAPLVVVLHGCTQTAAGYDLGSGWSRLADEAGFALLFPEQQRANNPNLCFNWFLAVDARRDMGEARSIFEMIEAFAVAHGIDRRRIFITGLSAGGAMTSVMLASYPEVFAGGAIIAGLPFGVANTVPEAFDRMRGHGHTSTSGLQSLLRNASGHHGPWPTVSVWHGSADHTVAPSNMDLIVDQWRTLHAVGDSPAFSELVGKHLRQVWRNEAGNDVIESYRIVGMGHGTPLSTAGDDAYGASGPYMLNVGISSTLRIAQFWQIVGPEHGTFRPHTRDSSVPAATPPVRSSGQPNPRLLHPEGRKADQGTNSTDGLNVQRVIEDALRKAGLMK